MCSNHGVYTDAIVFLKEKKNLKMSIVDSLQLANEGGHHLWM